MPEALPCCGVGFKSRRCDCAKVPRRFCLQLAQRCQDSVTTDEGYGFGVCPILGVAQRRDGGSPGQQ